MWGPATRNQIAITAAFSQPDADGAFRGHFGDYLNSLGGFAQR